MEKLETGLQYLMNGILAGKIEPWLCIAGIALGIVLIRKIVKWAFEKWGWFLGVIAVILLCVIVHGLYTQPEAVEAAFYKVTAKVERFIATTFS